MRTPTVFVLGSALLVTLALARPAHAADDKNDDTAPRAAAPPATVEPPTEEPWDIHDTHEKEGQKYYFVGLRYRGDVIPAFMFHPFVDLGKTIYTNAISAEFEIRKDGYSLIPALTYHELGTGDILFRQKNEPDIPGNYSLVNSGMKVVYAQLDMMWSVPIRKHLEFEYGLGFGIGAVFGSLETNWVQESPNGELASDNGKRYSPCATVLPAGTGCNKADHQNASHDKVGGYQEPSWFNGGAKPTVLPWLSIPQLGLRFKPIKNIVARLQAGFSLTGFWFGLGAQYGLEKKPKP